MANIMIPTLEIRTALRKSLLLPWELSAKFASSAFSVQELGNNLEKCKNNETLQQILTNATIMVVSVTASTTQGWEWTLVPLLSIWILLNLTCRMFTFKSVTFRSMLTEEELKQLEEACDMALELNQSKHRIYEYVESRMSFIAPNLSIIVGASTAAKIMGEKRNRIFELYSRMHKQIWPFYIWFPMKLRFVGIAGGLSNLSKMPACNLMLLGAQRRTLSGFSSTSLLPHTGFIYHCDVVQSLPPVS